jgi:DNA topoisomerase-3
MTAKWEQRLHEIGEGKASPEEFMEQAKKLSLKLIDDAQKQSAEWSFEGMDLSEFKRERGGRKGRASVGTKVGKCMKCDGEVVDKGTFYGCSNYSKTQCNFTISKKILGKSISATNAKKLLSGGRTDEIKGFKKGEKVFNAALEWKDDRVQFVFEK